MSSSTSFPTETAGTTTTDIENRTLYVGGLSENVDESLLQAAFIPFGEIVEVEVAREPKTGAHKGYGFVSYEAVEDAAAAVENMNHSEMFGRVLRVSFARAGSGGSGGGGRGGSASGSVERRRPVWEGEGYYEAKAAAEAEAESKGKKVVYKSVQNEGEGFSTEGADEDGADTNVKRVFFAPQGMK